MTAQLDELKQLLLGAEREKLSELRARLDDREARLSETAELLPEAVEAGHARDKRLVQALREPVNSCLRDSIRSNPEELSNALFPVIGPAVRRLINDTLKTFTENINRVIDQSVSPRAFAWRFESMRTGVPFADIVLKNTLKYRVEQAFLVQPSSGLLIEHVEAEGGSGQDKDAVSAMLTAIRDFVNDSFGGGKGGELASAEVGDHTLWVAAGPRAMLACAIRGVPPGRVRELMQSVLEDIHVEFEEPLREFNGDREALRGVDNFMRECLVSEALAPEGQSRRPKRSFASKLLIFLLLLGLLAAGFSLWHSHRLAQWKRTVAAVGERMDAAPGIRVTGIETHRDSARISGLRDPLAPALADFVPAELDDAALSLDFRPYLSLDVSIHRQRIRQSLVLPAGVELDSSEPGIARLRGTADAQWIENISRLTVLPLGISRLDLSGLSAAQPDWMGDWQRARSLADNLTGSRVGFLRDAEFDESAPDQLDRLSEGLKELIALSRKNGFELRLQLRGYTDDSGGASLNRTLRRRRSAALAAELTARGVDPQLIGLKQPEGKLVSARVAELEILLRNPEQR